MWNANSFNLHKEKEKLETADRIFGDFLQSTCRTHEEFLKNYGNDTNDKIDSNDTNDDNDNIDSNDYEQWSFLFLLLLQLSCKAIK